MMGLVLFLALPDVDLGLLPRASVKEGSNIDCFARCPKVPPRCSQDGCRGCGVSDWKQLNCEATQQAVPHTAVENQLRKLGQTEVVTIIRSLQEETL